MQASPLFSLTSALPIAAQWIGLITLVILGLVAIYGVFDGAVKTRTKEKDTLEEKLISTFRERVGQLEQSLKETVVDLEKMRGELIKLKTENLLLTSILKGRDDDSIKYREQVLEAIKLAPEILELSRNHQRDMEHLLRSMDILSLRVSKGEEVKQ